MAWEWIGTTVVRVAGIGATYWTAKRSREQAERLSVSAQEHARQTAREERRQKRIGEAYEELLVWVFEYEAWAGAWARPPGAPVPEHPGDEELRRVRAVVRAHGSSTVYESFAKLSDVMAQIELARLAIDASARSEQRGEGPWPNVGEDKRKLERELLPAMRERSAWLAREIKNDLHGTAAGQGRKDRLRPYNGKDPGAISDL